MSCFYERNRLTVLFVMPKLQSGGIERNSIYMMERCVCLGLGVHLALIEVKGELLRDIPSGVEVFILGSPSKLAFPMKLSTLLRKSPPSFIISAFDDVNVMVLMAQAFARSDVPILLSNHNAFSVSYSRSKGLKRLKNSILRLMLPWTFRRARSVVAVSKGVADDLSQFLRFPRERIEVIYNPVIDDGFFDRVQAPPTHSVTRQNILFVGRLVPQKDIPNLLAACALLKQHSAVDLLIVGDGPERANLEAMVQEMGLADSVRFAGMVHNPLPLMAGSGVLVLPSRFEGLGNVLIEAMTCGTQVVSTDCPHGPAEILENGELGQLVPVGDPQALAMAIERSLSGAFRVEPERLRARGLEFSVEKATCRYLELAGYDISTLPPPASTHTQTDPAAG